MSKIALIVVNAAAPNSIDVAFKARIVGAGHTCDYISWDHAAWDYSSYDAIWVGYGIGVGLPCGWNPEKPVGNISYNLYDDMGFGTHYAYNTSQWYMDIIDNSHYITSPWPLGNLQISTGNKALTTVMGFAKGVKCLAQLVGDATKAVVAYCEIGDILVNDWVAAGRRVAYGVYNHANMHENAWVVFDRMTEWLLMAPANPYSTSSLKKGFVSGYHCFMNAYIGAKITDLDPLKLPDGTIF